MIIIIFFCNNYFFLLQRFFGLFKISTEKGVLWAVVFSLFLLSPLNNYIHHTSTALHSNATDHFTFYTTLTNPLSLFTVSRILFVLHKLHDMLSANKQRYTSLMKGLRMHLVVGGNSATNLMYTKSNGRSTLFLSLPQYKAQM